MSHPGKRECEPGLFSVPLGVPAFFPLTRVSFSHTPRFLVFFHPPGKRWTPKGSSNCKYLENATTPYLLKPSSYMQISYHYPVKIRRIRRLGDISETCELHRITDNEGVLSRILAKRVYIPNRYCTKSRHTLIYLKKTDGV